MDPIIVTGAALVEAALLDDTLVPPDPPPNLEPGETRDLRQRMARFSPPETHSHRRAAVDAAAAELTVYPFAAAARDRSAAILGATDDARFDAIERLGLAVPVEVVALALGVPEPDLVGVRHDVRSIAEVIGRQQRSSPASDHATARLLQRFGGDTPAGVATVSLLYQTHDATAALFGSHLLARRRDEARRSAVAATIRCATAATMIGSTAIPRGATVSVDLDSTGFEFGVGPHACPGRAIAERIVAGMLDAIDAVDFELCVDDVEWQPDGRPRTLPMTRVGERS
ncbi:MAG: hypothetical protein HKN44_00905 [Ilumatobacter sp.]|nr:hypothetical protein [Ilumatobacter sp.]